MKKILLLMVLCLGSYALMAELPFNIGVHGGINNTKLKLKTSELKSKARNGYMFGAFARLNLGPIYLEPALNFSHKEGKVEYEISGSDKLKYNSFEIPVMVGFNVLDLPIFKLRVFAGPAVSFSSKIKVDNIKLDSDKTMWSGKVGVGFDVWKVTFDVDYEHGFKKFDGGIKAPQVYNFTVGFKII
ncbi:PorT family protein [Odoribacter sp. OttesenSCG-928-G04]|nr:PorT family protein [Odoribacter sp. OttesenSCG-928-G04]MDL2331177.1 PorT family protein [Odoribacter sp. OttesenSCG-928-A06]